MKIDNKALADKAIILAKKDYMLTSDVDGLYYPRRFASVVFALDSNDTLDKCVADICDETGRLTYSIGVNDLFRTPVDTCVVVAKDGEELCFIDIDDSLLNYVRKLIEKQCPDVFDKTLDEIMTEAKDSM